MKLGIMQPYFFPYIGYWQLINCVDKYIIYDDVNFIKGGWINRNNILVNGEGKLINIRMHNASSNKLINEVEVLDDSTSRAKTLRTIENNYRKAPFFKQVYPIIENIINQKENNLGSFLTYEIKRICEYLLINTDIVLSSEIQKNNDLKGQDKVIEICKIMKAKEYVNAIGGQQLYSNEVFAENGIKLKFLQANIRKYNQFNNDFVPNLSIIDIMMFNSQSEIKDMLNDFKLNKRSV